MLKLDNGANGKAANAKQPETFFTQYIATPGAVHGQINFVAPPGSGIPMRDYFAAKAMQGFLSPDNGLMIDTDSDNFPAIADDAYRLADAMLKARQPEKPENYSQFHEDHMKPLGR